MYILNLIRWKNSLILIFSALLIRISLLPGFGVDPELSLFHHSLLTLAVVCIGAGGNMINDFFDIIKMIAREIIFPKLPYINDIAV